MFGGLEAVRNILVMLLAYNLSCVLAFSTVYHAVGLRNHFAVPDGFEDSFLNCMYYAFAVQTTCMAGEVYPKTQLGRTLLSFQLLSSWMSTMVLIVPWVRAATTHSSG